MSEQRTCYGLEVDADERKQVCQIAKIHGCKVIGIAGGKEKCEWLEKDLGIIAIDYKDANFHANVKKLGYLDVYCEL